MAALYEKIAGIDDKTIMFSAALANYGHSQKVFKKTIISGQGYSVAQRDFFSTKHKTSRMQLACGNPLAALISEREALAIADPILLANPEDRNWKIFVANVMLFTAHAAASLVAVEDPSAATNRGLELLESIATVESQNPAVQRDLTSLKEFKFVLDALPAQLWPLMLAASLALRFLKRLRINCHLSIPTRGKVFFFEKETKTFDYKS